ncbi:MAG: ATP-dependent helicase, partial [Peptostreptococcaceae bacterium]
ILLLNTSTNAQEFIRKTFTYIHADEVQDSNTSNIILINMLSKNCNLFMVGDIDQSIYGFRGAKPDYLVKYTEMNNNSKLFKLEQNYRSTKIIVNSSNSVIANNDGRIDKVCFSEQESGDRITYIKCPTDRDEANFIANEIRAYKAHGESFSDIMILYRTNSQSRLLEEVFISEDIPYTIVGSLSFNDRAEIKDCLSFLKIAVNKKDKTSFMRSLGTLDGIGKKTIEELISLHDVKKDALDTLKSYQAKTARSKVSIEFFINILKLIDEKPTGVLRKIASYHIDRLRSEGTPKSIEKIENIEELVKVAIEKENNGIMLKDFVSQMDLLSSKDKDSKPDSLTMMTIHASKGLESKIVFIAGMNDGILPHDNSLTNQNDIEEERRLAYVAMTRSKKKLYISSFDSNNQKIYDSSRFIEEIPDMYIEKI